MIVLLEYYVHPVDTAKLHVAAATDSNIRGQRIFAFAEPFTWNQILDICRKARPSASIPQDSNDQRKDLSTVDNELAKQILKERFDQDGFIPLEQGVKDALESFL
jgi:nucleoside-diphosphate-sugar epimerase